MGRSFNYHLRQKGWLAVFAILLFSYNAYSIDTPHFDLNHIGCDSCHFVYGSQPSLLPEWTEHTPQNIDDTQYNTLCWSCHDDVEAPYYRTHSSLQIDNGYGDWTIECRVCHNPHYQRQFRAWGSESYLYSDISTGLTASTLSDSQAVWTTNAYQGLVLVPDTSQVKYNYKILGNSSDTLTVKGPMELSKLSSGSTYAIVYGKLLVDEVDLGKINPPKSGTRPVKLFDSAGQNSFADGDGVYDGICEACHTLTLYHRNDETGDHSHNPGVKCTTCHQHIEGFKGSGCDVCHGYPPVISDAIGGPSGLVNNPGVTNSNTAGVHDKHVNTKLYTCEVCHFNSAGSGPTHNSNLTVTLGFSLFGGTYPGGMYDGQTGVSYDTAEVNTTVINTGSLACDNIYCHSNAAPFDKANEYRSPVWDGAGSLTCASCHDSGGSSSGLSGRHPKHTAESTYAFVCEKCHSETASGSDSIKNESYHVNNSKDIIFASGGSYDSSVKSCTSTYCHSDAAGGLPNMNVEWDVAATIECYSCHSGRPDDDTPANCSTIGGTWDGTSESCTFPDQSSCESNKGVWDDSTGCYTVLTMRSNGHKRLVSKKWIREYKCYYCHFNTADLSNNISGYAAHLNEAKDIAFPQQWHLFSGPAPSYDDQGKVCDNVYCHTDGTTVDPEVRPYPWDGAPRGCNACHGHEGNCSECHTDITGWEPGLEWRSAMPMYANEGPGLPKSNTHLRHILTDFTCDQCHVNTILGGSCTSAGCHEDGIPPGSMFEYGHVDSNYHVNKVKDVYFQDGGTYDSRPNYKKCSNTACHTGADPQWGDSINSLILCFECHGSTTGDVDDFTPFNDERAKIDMNKWAETGHGRPAASGNYPYSGNPPADFPGNPCWYCHDNKILHNDPANPFRLNMHEQYEQRFDKECVYCHMEGLDTECLSCHNTADPSLAPQLDDINSPPYSVEHDTWNTGGDIDGYSTCLDVSCHGGSPPDPHNTGAGIWEDYEKWDVKNQYMMMGVCLKCHDDDSNGKCTECHTAPPEDPDKYSTGFDPGTGLITATSKATSTHFGYKHFAAYETSFGVQADSGTVSENASSTAELKDNSKSWTVDEWAGDYVMMTGGSNTDEYRRIVRNTSNTLVLAEEFTNPVQSGDTYYLNDPVWKGGKFCWDCHDPHGDSNIYMIQDEVATETDGTFGIPVTKRAVTFTQKATGLDYVRTSGPVYDGICNVCHTDPDMHYRFDYGDGHNSGRICTECHEHRFSDSHASGQSCTECHGSKPVPRHSGFGLPRDCTKCHAGLINKRVDIITQLSATNSHHIQGVEVTNRHCYACHWEATEDGLINLDYHSGYNYETHGTVKNAAADLVIWGPGVRPTTYELGVTATQFLATDIGTANERSAVSNVTMMCLGCHSAQNNETQPFNIVEPLQGDCKTPNQYAWDGTSIGERYSQTETTTWGKYETVPDAAQKNITKAFSAHGNAVNNDGGWNDSTGLDGTIPNTRGGDQNVQCFDCHSSHGSRTEGITSSYVTFNGTNNGANLKETQAGKGGYQYTYKARANTDPDAVNPYNEGAAQCFDCHQTETARTELYPGSYSPWGYADTFGADAGIGIMGYKDTSYFGQGVKASTARFPFRASKATIVGGHLNASKPVKDLGTATSGTMTALIDTGKSWADDEWTGFFVLIKSGDNAGEMRKINSNTATVLTVYTFDNAVGTDDYEIVQPMVKETGTASGGSTAALDDAGKSWSSNEWTGYFLLMLTGDNAGKTRRITANTATQISAGKFPDNVAAGDSYEIVPYAKTINGLCTPCHDPHGVSPTLGENQRYGVPLLKGTWLTSPYKEDHPPDDPSGNCASKEGYEFNVSWGRTRCAPSSALNTSTHYQIDRNTFNFDRITEEQDRFAGLCLRCHPKENLTDGIVKNTEFRTKDRIHESVKGWGENTEHSWACSKCHQPHVSGLPRLMQTNCLDYNHRGYRESGGVPWSTHLMAGQSKGHYRGYPIGNVMGNSSSYRAQNMCHTQATPNPDVWPDSNRWNDVTPW